MLANSNTKYQLLLARDLEYISEDTYEELRSGYDRVIQMLSRLSQSLGNDPRTRSRSEGQSRPRHDEQQRENVRVRAGRVSLIDRKHPGRYV